MSLLQKFTRNFPLANDFNALAAKLMKPIEDYPTKEETYYVWEIKDWAQLLKEEKSDHQNLNVGI